MKNLAIFSLSLLMPMGGDIILIQELTTIVMNENTFNKFSSASEDFKNNVSATGAKDPSVTNYVDCSYKAALECFPMFSFDDTNGCILYTYVISSNEVKTCGSSAVIHLYVNYNPDADNCIEDPTTTEGQTTTGDLTITTEDPTATTDDSTTTTTEDPTATTEGHTTTEDPTTTTEDATTTTSEDPTTTTEDATTTTSEDPTTTTEDATTTTSEGPTITNENQTTTTDDAITTTSEDPITATENPTTTTEDTTTNASSCACGSENDPQKIVGGSETAVNQYPYIVRMLTTIVGDSTYSCGASILSETVVLTAAHCLKINGILALANNVLLQFGAHNIVNPPSSLISLTAKEVILHEEYNDETDDNDIAVVILQERLNFSREISPVCLPYDLDMTTLQDKISTAMGWGTLQSGGNSPDALQHVELGIVTNGNCETQFPGLNGSITENMFCAYSMGKDTCQGDSGGPLVYKQDGRDVQIGVVSWGFGCAAEDTGVYSRVVNYLTWIEEKADQSFCKP